MHNQTTSLSSVIYVCVLTPDFLGTIVRADVHSSTIVHPPTSRSINDSPDDS